MNDLLCIPFILSKCVRKRENLLEYETPESSGQRFIQCIRASKIRVCKLHFATTGNSYTTKGVFSPYIPARLSFQRPGCSRHERAFSDAFTVNELFLSLGASSSRTRSSCVLVQQNTWRPGLGNRLPQEASARAEP